MNADVAVPDLLEASLPDVFESLENSDEYARRDPGSRTLIRLPDLRVVAIALKAETTIRKHDVSGPVSIQCLQGACRVVLDAGQHQLTAGKLVMLPADVQHEVIALEDSRLLLTIGRTHYDALPDHLTS